MKTKEMAKAVIVQAHKDPRNMYDVVVKCPICHGSHEHGYNPMHEHHIRTSHCHRGEYVLVDPDGLTQ